MNQGMRVIAYLVASVFGVAVSGGPARAELVGTDQAAASVEPAAPNADREKVRAFLERPEVVEKLKAMGVSADDAKVRVGALSDAEVHAMAGNLDSFAAGGRLTDNDLLLIIVVVLAVVLLIIVL